MVLGIHCREIKDRSPTSCAIAPRSIELSRFIRRLSVLRGEAREIQRRDRAHRCTREKIIRDDQRAQLRADRRHTQQDMRRGRLRRMSVAVLNKTTGSRITLSRSNDVQDKTLEEQSYRRARRSPAPSGGR
jgi:hypothetical protein